MGGRGGPQGSNAGQKSWSSHLWPMWAMCPTAWSTKGVSQVILHMLLSGFFNTCSFCFCQPALHGDINLWLADSQAQVSAYSCGHIRTLDFPERIRLFFQALKQTFVTVFPLSSVAGWGPETLSFFSPLNIVLIVSMNKTVASADALNIDSALNWIYAPSLIVPIPLLCTQTNRWLQYF